MKLEVTRIVCGLVPYGTDQAPSHNLQRQSGITEHGVQQRRKISQNRALSVPCMLGLFLAAVATLIPAPDACAQSTTTGGFTTGPIPTSPPITTPLSPSQIIPSATYATAGIALRNRGAGNISISGFVGAPTVAYIYWAVLCPTSGCPVPSTQIEIEQLFPGVVGPVLLAGTQIGMGPTPCWGAGNVVVFRAPVPLAIATGNGSYQITIPPGGQAIVNGASPWSAFALPTWEGASLVLIGPSPSGVGTVSIYDVGLAGNMFVPVPAFNYTLALPVPVPAGSSTFLDNIGADGQHFVPRAAILPVSDETTSINAVPIAGPGSQYNDSDWNGSAGFTLTELWDDTAHDITAAAPAGTNLLKVSIGSAAASTGTTGFPADCLVTVANIVQE